MKALEAFKKVGEADGAVVVDISYDIIRHVSSQLYTSPRKAIEELVCNSYDAGADQCWVTLPAGADDSLLVLDNGKSMDRAGLDALWQVARSPKADPDDPEKRRIANRRLQIGKFGVGKLAAFALGKRLTHITCTKGTVRIVSVAQDAIREKGNNRAPRFNVYKTTPSKAKAIVEPLLGTLPKPWDSGWSTWTLAIVGDVDEPAAKSQLRTTLLRRMISTALPVSAKFKTFLDGEAVPKNDIAASKIKLRVDVTDKAFREELSGALRSYWADKEYDDKEEDVPAQRVAVTLIETPDPEDTTKKLAAINVPELGPVSGDAIATKETLATGKLVERQYANNGFFITALGKLVNPEDPLFGVSALTHKYWSRFLARVEMPGLDRVLLVQRNAVSDRTPEAELAQVVVRTLFNHTRKRVDERDAAEEGGKETTLGSRLRSSAPILAQAGLKGLLAGTKTKPDLEKLSVDFCTLGGSKESVRFDKKTLTMLVNSDHPLLVALDEHNDTGKQLRRVVGDVLSGTLLARGLLMAHNVAQELIEDIDAILDAAMRSAAAYIRDPVEDHIEKVDKASRTGDRPFERAVIDALRSMRLVANHHGGPDEPDGIVEIPQSGKENIRISVEAKGSNGVIDHRTLAEATVTRHTAEFNCRHAIAIAREYATVGIGHKESALLRETKGKVPLLTTSGLALMLRLHRKRNFTYDKVIKIFTTWTHPDELLRFIEQTWQEMPDRGLIRLILTAAEDYINKDSTNKPDPGVIVADSRVRERKVTKENVKNVLTTIQLATQMITIDPSDYSFDLNAPVDSIVEAMGKTFDGSDTPTKETKS